jgi:hypothetical protein
MSALTRIFNNQIYNATIVGFQKIAPGTLTGSLFASNVTVPGDLLISGNLFVLGSSAYTTIASTNTYVNDPLVVLNNGFSGTNNRDIGLVLNRGTDQNQAIIWSETFSEFRLIATNDTGTTYGNITAAGLARLSVGSLSVPGQANIGSIVIDGSISGASLNVTGNVLAATVGASYVTASTATIGNISAVTLGNTGTQFNGSAINLSGNVLAAAGLFNELTVNGNETISGWINAGGNISTSQLNAGQINTTGNVLATSGTFNELTVNGNELVTGYLNVSGNVLGASATFSSVLSNGTINTTGNVLAQAGTFNDLTVNGNETVSGWINAGGNISTPQLNAGQINTTGNVLATSGVFNELTVNGNETVTGYLNVSGNVMSSGAIHNNLDVNGNVDLGLVGAVSGSWVTVAGNITQTSSGGPVYFNTTGNILASQLNAGQINTTGNVLATSGVFNELTVNGNETVTGYLNVSGNVLASTIGASYITASTATIGNIAAVNFGNAGATFTGASINLSGNVLAAAGTFNELTVNGNETVTGYLNVSGNVLSAGAVHNYLDVNGNVDLGLAGAISGSWVNVVGNITQTSAGGPVYINTTGNILAASGVFGALSLTGFINTSGNISGAQINAGQINTTGNVLAQAGVFNELTVNGNETVTGYLNVSGNILGDTGTLSILGVSNTLWANSSAVTTTQGTGAIVVPNGGISVAGAANIAGAITTAGAAQFNNTITVGGISSFTNTTNASDATGTTGALRIQGGASINKDLWVGGNIYASNIFGVTHQVITVKDPLVYFDAANTFPYSYDIGFYSNFVGPNSLDNTGNAYQHTGVVRDNADNTWKFFSNVRPEPGSTSIAFNSDTIYDPVRAGNLTLTFTQAATSTTTGALQVAGGAGIVGTVVAGQINSTGNVLGQAGTFNALTVNGGITSSGFFNTSGNISAAEVKAGQINTTGNVVAATVLAQLVTADDATFGNVVAGFIGNTGTAYTGASINLSANVLAAAGTFNGLTVNGNETISGWINAGGNISTPQLNAGQINTTGNLVATTVLAQLVTADDATFGNVDAGFIGNVGTAYTGASINLSANILAAAATFNALTVNGNETISGWINAGGNISTPQLNAGQINTTGNVLAQAGVFNVLTVNGNHNVTGNVLASTVGASFLTASTAAVGNISAVTIGNAGATVTGTAGTFGAVTSGFIGNVGTSYTGASINLSGNVIANTVLAQLVTADDATFGNVEAGFIGNVGTVYTGASINLSANVLAAAGTFNGLTVNGNESVTGYLNVTGNVMTAQLNAGQINTTGNVLAATVGANFLTASTAEVGNISAVTIGNTGATITGTTAAFDGNVIGGLAQFAAINNTPIGNATASTGAFTTLSASAGIWANSTTDSTTTTTGAIVVAGGIGLAGNIRAGGGSVINDSQTADPFQVKGVATTSLIYADTAQGAVVIGGSNVAPQLGSTLKINGTDTLLLPIGSSAQRPSTTGNIDIAGMIRFNTTIQNMEFYDGTIWQTAGSVFTVISDRQFSGNVGGGYGNVDGTNTVFTIQANSTTAGTIVSINGVVQFPVLAYGISGTTLTFTEPPAPEDVIDVRVLSTTSSISTLASGNGLQQFIAGDQGLELWTGTSATFKRVEIDRVGNMNMLAGQKLTYEQTPTNIAANNTPYIISTWDQTEYTTAKYVISAKRGATNFQSMEALVTSDGQGNAFITTYAVQNNGTDMGGLTANVVGGNVQVYWTTTTNITNANVKAMGTYIV